MYSAVSAVTEAYTWASILMLRTNSAYNCVAHLFQDGYPPSNENFTKVFASMEMTCVTQDHGAVTMKVRRISEGFGCKL